MQAAVTTIDFASDFPWTVLGMMGTFDFVFQNIMACHTFRLLRLDGVKLGGVHSTRITTIDFIDYATSYGPESNYSDESQHNATLSVIEEEN